MKSKFTLVLACIILLSSFIGCKDIAGTLKARFNKATQSTSATSAGNFGNTSEEQAMINAVTEKYGDLREQGSPRILELMLCSSVVNHIPADRVSQYSSNTPKFYAWFIYDNFNEATISVEWLYLDDNYSIGTSRSKTGKDFGRGSFTLEAPDDGWPLGKYRVKVSGKGVTETVDFQVISGSTVSVAILQPDGSVDLEGTSSGSTSGSSGSSSSSTSTSASGSGAGTTPASSSGSATGSEYTIFNNINTGSVSSGPSATPTFTISQTHVITSVLNYHWNGGKGATPGIISLKHSDGTLYGPWNTIAAYSNGDQDTSAPYHYWLAKPNIAIKAGTYTIIDGDAATWSYNSSSKNAGFSKVRGYKSSAAPAAGTSGTSGTSATSSSSSSSSSSSAASSSSSGQQVWHLKSYRYEPWAEDRKERSTYQAGTTSVLIDYCEAEGGKYTGFRVSVKRMGADHKIIYAGTANALASTTSTVITEPPEYIRPDERPSLTVSHKVISTTSWGANSLYVHFPGTNYAFKKPDGNSIGTNYEGKVTMERGAPAGGKGQTRELVYSIGGYKFIYTYEWLD